MTSGPVTSGSVKSDLASLPSSRRRVLFGAVGAVTLLELVLAWTTHGTFDIDIWRSFAATVHRVGPIQIYDTPDAGLMVYNHPALVGWWLIVVNAVTSLGVPLGFIIRLPSIVAHVASVVLVFELVNRRRPEHAWASALAVAVTPLLTIIAGFHGNNDPVVAALLLASVWALVDRRVPLVAGVLYGLSTSVKIVPIVVLPILLVAAWRLGRADLRRFLLGGAAVFVLVWGPTLALAPVGYLKNVILYNGSGFPRVWGPYQFLAWLHLPTGLLNLYVRPGTQLVIMICALVPAWFIRNTPQRAPLAVGTALSLFMLISPAWAAQYVAWIAAAIFLVDLTPALIFTIGGGAVWITEYIWWRGDVRAPSLGQTLILQLGWLALVPVVVAGLRALRDHQEPALAPSAADEG